MDTQPNKVFMGRIAERATGGGTTVRIGDGVICKSADGELPGSGKVIAILHNGGTEHTEYVVQVGPNLIGVYLIGQLICPSTESEPLDSVDSVRRAV